MKKVLTGGVFNIIHQGHIWFLKRAGELGDCLVVIVANDKTVLKKKPLIKPQEERKEALESLGIADKVIIGDERDFLRIVKKERPDIIALGYDQELDKDFLKAVRELGCKVVKIKRFGSYSTSRIMKKNKQGAG